jgi:hypothetical protein
MAIRNEKKTGLQFKERRRKTGREEKRESSRSKGAECNAPTCSCGLPQIHPGEKLFREEAKLFSAPSQQETRRGNGLDHTRLKEGRGSRMDCCDLQFARSTQYHARSTYHGTPCAPLGPKQLRSWVSCVAGGICITLPVQYCTVVKVGCKKAGGNSRLTETERSCAVIKWVL